MSKFIQVIILGIFLIFTNGFEIDDHSEDQTVKLGDPFTLSCHVTNEWKDWGNEWSKDWKKCTWTHTDGLPKPSDCVFTYLYENEVWKVQSDCSGMMTDAEFVGDDPEIQNRLCGMNFVESDKYDNGNWTCAIEQCQTGGVNFGCREDDGNGIIVSASMNVEIPNEDSTIARPTTTTKKEPNTTTPKATTTMKKSTTTRKVTTTTKINTTTKKATTTAKPTTTTIFDGTTSKPDGYTCDDLILDQCPEERAWLIETVEDSELKNCMTLCDDVVENCKSFLYSNTTKLCKLYSCTVDSYMARCAKFGSGADTLGNCVTDDSKYPDPCKNILEGECDLPEQNVIHHLYGVKYEDECFLESQYWGGSYYVMRNDTQECRIYDSNERQCQLYRGPNGAANCEVPITLYDI